MTPRGPPFNCNGRTYIVLWLSFAEKDTFMSSAPSEQPYQLLSPPSTLDISSAEL